MEFKVLFVLALTAFALAECRSAMSSKSIASSEESYERTANDLQMPKYDDDMHKYDDDMRKDDDYMRRDDNFMGRDDYYMRRNDDDIMPETYGYDSRGNYHFEGYQSRKPDQNFQNYVLNANRDNLEYTGGRMSSRKYQKDYSGRTGNQGSQQGVQDWYGGNY